MQTIEHELAVTSRRSVKPTRNGVVTAVVALALLATGISAGPASARLPEDAQQIAVCVKALNGQVRVMQAHESSCDPAEEQSAWTIGGEVTKIVAGRGITAAEQENGVVEVGLDEGVLQSQGRVILGSKPSAVLKPNEEAASPRHSVYFARLVLPAGRWHVLATFDLQNMAESPFDTYCRLHAGDLVDATEAHLRDRPYPGERLALQTAEALHEEVNNVFLGCEVHKSLAAGLVAKSVQIVATEAAKLEQVSLIAG